MRGICTIYVLIPQCLTRLSVAGIGSRRPSSCQSLLTFREKANFRVGQNQQKNRVILQREGIRDGDNLIGQMDWVNILKGQDHHLVTWSTVLSFLLDVAILQFWSVAFGLQGILWVQVWTEPSLQLYHRKIVMQPNLWLLTESWLVISHMWVSLTLTIISGYENGSLDLTKELDLACGFIHTKILTLSREFAFRATFNEFLCWTIKVL